MYRWTGKRKFFCVFITSSLWFLRGEDDIYLHPYFVSNNLHPHFPNSSTVRHLVVKSWNSHICFNFIQRFLHLIIVNDMSVIYLRE